VGRFSNLEYDGHDPLREARPAFVQETRDEGYYLEAADGEYRAARFDRALRYYSRALEYNANVHAAWVGQVQMLIELGEFVEAKLWADKALEVHRDHPEILSAKAVAWARLGDTRRAVALSDAALSQRGATPTVWLARGEALLADGQANDEHCLEKAAAEALQNWFMQLRIARVLQAYRRFARAMSWVTKALKQEPGAPFVHHTLGDCQDALGFGTSAARSYRRALALDGAFSLSRAALDRLEGRGLLGRVWCAVAGAFRWGVEA